MRDETLQTANCNLAPCYMSTTTSRSVFSELYAARCLTAHYHTTTTHLHIAHFKLRHTPYSIILCACFIFNVFKRFQH